MAEDKRHILSKTIDLKRRGLAPYKRFHVQGEAAYDYAAYVAARRKKACLKTADDSRTVPSLPSDGCCQEERNIPSRSNVRYQKQCNESNSTILPCEVVEECLNTIELYKHLLISNKGVTLSRCGRTLVMSDFDPKNQLLSKDLVIIERRAFSFLDGTTSWVLWCCVCCEDGDRLRNLNQILNVAQSEMHLANCIHKDVASLFFVTLDGVNNIVPRITTKGDDHSYGDVLLSGQQEWFEVEVNEVIVGACIHVKFVPGVVIFKNNQLYCTTCKKFACDHTKSADQLKASCVDFQDTVDQLHVVKRSCSNDGGKPYSTYSMKKISFMPNNDMSDALKRLPQIDQTTLLKPNVGVACLCGSTTFEESVAYEECDIITMTCLAKLKVLCQRCIHCSLVVYYDGVEDGLVNMGTYMVGYDILRRYMHSFLHGRRPMHTFYQVTCDMLVEYGYENARHIFVYDKFRRAWYAFLNLLDIDVMSGFVCPECSSTPDLVVCDGTSISFQRRMWTWQQLNKVDDAVIDVQSRFNKRIFTCNVRLRKLLKRYAMGGTTKNGKKVENLTKEDKITMMNEAAKTSKALYDFLIYVDDDEDSLIAPQAVQDLIKSLSSSSAVCSYVHFNGLVKDLINDICSGVNVKESPPHWKTLREQLPLIFKLVDDPLITCMPQALVKLLQVLWSIVESTFSESDEVHVDSSVIEEDELAFFPSLPKVRNRGSYSCDVKKVSSAKSCNKTYTGHPTLLPGVFTVYCRHGICYGFQVMQSHESPNIPFSIFRTRFKKAPSTVVYDNACSLHSYVLNRDPIHFRNTDFFVDRLHWHNHTGCSSGYCLARYPLLSTVNSQVNEQGNAGLQRIKDQLSYMTAGNFMRHCAFYLWNKNRLQKDHCA